MFASTNGTPVSPRCQAFRRRSLPVHSTSSRSRMPSRRNCWLSCFANWNWKKSRHRSSNPSQYVESFLTRSRSYASTSRWTYRGLRQPWASHGENFED
jgi:hypothetical protein